MPRGIFRIRAEGIAPGRVQTELNNGTTRPLAEAAYRAFRYEPSIEELPWQAEYERAAGRPKRSGRRRA